MLSAALLDVHHSAISDLFDFLKSSDGVNFFGSVAAIATFLLIMKKLGFAGKAGPALMRWIMILGLLTFALAALEGQLVRDEGEKMEARTMKPEIIGHAAARLLINYERQPST